MTHADRAARRLTAAVLLTALTAIAGAGPAFGADDPDLESEPNLDQQIDPDQPVATDRAVLSDGHVDIGPRYVDGEWTLLVHDDHAEPPTWRTLPRTVFQVADASLTTVPDSADYAFLPAEPGTQVHVVPQAQQPEVIWVGWNTQDPTVMDGVDRGATLRLRGVRGPGDVVMFLQSGTLGAPEVLWDSREPYPQDVWVEVNTHTHANWVFSEPGVYLVEVEVSAALVSGETVSDTQLLRFAVGDTTSTDEAFAADYAVAPGAEPTATTTPAAAGGSGDGGSGDGGAPALAVAGVLGAVGVLAAVLATVLVRGWSAKRRAAAQLSAGAAPGAGPEGRR